jgi:hypothetical protein
VIHTHFLELYIEFRYLFFRIFVATNINLILNFFYEHICMYVCVLCARGDYKCFFTCDMSGALLNIYIYIYISLQLERFQSVYLNKKDELYNFPK